MKNIEKYLMSRTFVLVFTLLIINPVYAEMLTSEVGVKYDSKVLDEFIKIKNNETNDIFVKIIIDLKNISEADDLFSSFSKDEIWYIKNSSISPRISARITKKGFDKLIQDDRVENIYYNAPIHAFEPTDTLNGKKFLIQISVILFILILLIIILLIINKIGRRIKNNIDNKKGKSKKKVILLIVLIGFIFLVVNIVNAEMLVSDYNVSYESEILKEFEGEIWIDVIIDIKDFSNITISGKDSMRIQIAKDKQRNEVFNNVTESVLATLSEDEFKYKDKMGRTIFGYITEKGFNKLLNNPNIKAIYLEKYVSLFGKNRISLSYMEEPDLRLPLIVISVIMLVIIILIVYIIIKRRRLNKFLKPTIWKIILTIVLTLIIIYYVVNINVACLFQISCSKGYRLYSPPFIPMCPICMNKVGIILTFILPLVGYLLFSYLISCLITFIINKLKREK